MSNPREALTVFHLAEATFPNYYELEPETLKEGVGLSDLECEMVFVCQEIFTNHNVFRDWHVFEKAICVLNGRPANFLVTQELDPSEVVWGIEVIRKLDPESHFSEEVLSYIAVIFYDSGLIFLPESLKCEKSSQEIGLSFLFRMLYHHPKLNEEQEKIQNGMLHTINEYVSLRRMKSEMELRTQQVKA